MKTLTPQPINIHRHTREAVSKIYAIEAPKINRENTQFNHVQKKNTENDDDDDDDERHK